MTYILLEASAAQAASRAWLESLQKDSVVSGFQTEALYLNEDQQPMGGRFIHQRTGFTLDLLEIQSVPQTFLWVNSWPISDRGEPHTQEHLLLGKGNQGRAVASQEEMSLVESSAYTMQRRTCYHFNTTAGAEVYYKVFESRLDALLHPDYTDEEIRREVCNFGITIRPEDGKPALEEKGTVYNEMVSTTEKPWSPVYRAMIQAIYGTTHPLSYSAGGMPEAIRTMLPQHIRDFHRQNYHLGNMGMITSIPKEIPMEDFLQRMDSIFTRVQPSQETAGRKRTLESDLPPPAPAAAGAVRTVEYPHQNPEQPGPMAFIWPADRRLSPQEHVLLRIFMDTFAGDTTTNLYKVFLDTKTRTIDVGAQGVYGWVDDEPGNPFVLALADVTAANLNPEKAAIVRQKMLDELARVAAWPDGSSELAEFNARASSRVTEWRRLLSRRSSAPPGFGQRGVSSVWMTHLDVLAAEGSFRRSLTLGPELQAIEKLLSDPENPWRSRLADWKLTNVVPYTVMGRANPNQILTEDQQRRDRIAQELQRLQKVYGTPDEAQTLSRYQAEVDAATAVIDEAARKVEMPSFVETPPLGLDDLLEIKVRDIAGVPLAASTFENMNRATAGLVLRLDGVPADRMVYLALLPQLLTGVGVLEGGKPVSYDEMSERLRQEILALSAYFSSQFKSGRYELVVRGAGNTLEESQRALGWMRRVLESPDWRPENLPRLRDLVDQSLAGLRGTMQAPEEYWANGIGGAFRAQGVPLYMTLNSFLTQQHHALRLRWLLKDAGAPETASAIDGWLEALGKASAAPRADLLALVAEMQKEASAASMPESIKALKEAFDKLPAEAKALAKEAAKDLELSLPDVPDSSLAADWAYLCAQIRADLAVPPAQVLQQLNDLRAALLKRGNARMFLISSEEAASKLEPGLRDVASLLQDGKDAPVGPSTEGLIRQRLLARDPAAVQPLFVGLVNPNTQSGILLNTAPGTSLTDLDRESLLRHLTALLYSGGGAHSLFMRTWGAGLAYGNGVGANEISGRISHYAERCPELPQTLRFAIDELKRATPDPKLTSYAVARAFYSRSAEEYESRGEAMATDLVDGIGPEVFHRFRHSLLELQREPGLTDELFKRLPEVYSAVLPGFGAGPAPDKVPGAIYVVIGPEKQMGLYEQYLKTSVSPETRLFRLYPRDFWMPGPARP